LFAGGVPHLQPINLRLTCSHRAETPARPSTTPMHAETRVSARLDDVRPLRLAPLCVGDGRHGDRTGQFSSDREQTCAEVIALWYR